MASNITIRPSVLRGGPFFVFRNGVTPMIGKLAAAMLVLLSLCACSTTAVRGNHGEFVARESIIAGTTYRYQVFVPAQSAAGEHPPVILFLHGSGERGTDNRRQIDIGLGPYLRKRMDDFPAIVVFPQAPPNGEWIVDGLDAALAALDAATREFGGDTRRTYLTGVSMGGFGTWELALMAPKRFAALVPICGAITEINPDMVPYLGPIVLEPDPYAVLAARLRHMPIWIFHGAKDDVVSPKDDRKTYAALKAAGADVRYTEFPDANHNAWDPAYATPELWTWLFAQKRR